jgi:hypothetical protein
MHGDPRLVPAAVAIAQRRANDVPSGTHGGGGGRRYFFSPSGGGTGCRLGGVNGRDGLDLRTDFFGGAIASAAACRAAWSAMMRARFSSSLLTLAQYQSHRDFPLIQPCPLPQGN